VVALTSARHRSRPAQGPPPDDLRGFPRFTTRRACYRAHAARPDDDDLGCWWFASRPAVGPPGGRFDLPEPDGTCYLGLTEGVAVRERVGRFLAAGVPVPPGLIDGAVVSRVRLPTGRGSYAGVAHVEAAAFGVTAELSSGTDNYEVCVHWADALRSHGFAGIHYTPRFSPGGRETALAVFGGRGAHPEYGLLDFRPLADALIDLGYLMGRSALPSSHQVSVDDDAEP